MTPAELEAIGKRVAAATPGPMATCLEGSVVTVESERDLMTMADVAFYEHARAYVPALLAEVARLSTLAAAERAYRVALIDRTTPAALEAARAALIAAGGVP